MSPNDVFFINACGGFIAGVGWSAISHALVSPHGRVACLAFGFTTVFWGIVFLCVGRSALLSLP